MGLLETKLWEIFPLHLIRTSNFEYDKRAFDEGLESQGGDRRDAVYLIDSSCAFTEPADFLYNLIQLRQIYSVYPYMIGTTFGTLTEKLKENSTLFIDSLLSDAHQGSTLSIKLKDPYKVIINESEVPNTNGNKGGTIDLKMDEAGYLYVVKTFLGGHHDAYGLKAAWDDRAFHRPSRGILSKPIEEFNTYIPLESDFPFEVVTVM